MRTLPAIAVGATAAMVAAVCIASGAAASDHGSASAPDGAIKHVLVIDLENEDFNTSFGPTSPAKYLNDVIVPKGQLLTNYYATGHFSTDNYLAQISGQAPNKVSGNDCITDTKTFASTYTDVTPGTLDPNQAKYPGQVEGSGCVYPAAVKTIGDQLDARAGENEGEDGGKLTWRQYAEDMGNDPVRDHGTPDPVGGTDCAHPAANGTFPNHATTTDQYAIRHVPFLFFHSVTDNAASCAQHVVPLGSVKTGPDGDTFTGHLAEDLAQKRTTPEFAMVTPNVCNDGHDDTCVGPNTEGGHTGGLVAADLWLKHWMPLILDSPAYKSGEMLVVVTFDEASMKDSSACCGEQAGPDNANPGYPTLMTLFGGSAPTAPGQYPGGGRVGAVLLNSKWIASGSVNTTPYNHYSALRSYEDLLGIESGGSDGHGHLGFAGQTGLRPFGTDVFAKVEDAN
ncbi:alkaline phosphatase family protein [Sinomonas sp. ASV322]|uniref:alkaline phosphatase family protein n=1 Tax=Sinomonas sp. ASV322 TaxID=3041920 RepID=UPI0027DC1620|nr:alkaline phosphatase family protein [Sinomonas sp. ASV322]MDQ4503903.1 alkaline phosphatase family protein [Sinomonas sp. ASV322]